VCETVDIRRLAKADPTMIDAYLHPADVVAHNEKNIGPFRLLHPGRLGRNGQTGRQRDANPEFPEFLHKCLHSFLLWWLTRKTGPHFKLLGGPYGNQ
jgi:hypothetical protein